MADNIQALRRHRVVVWCKHGAMARSDVSVKRAADRIEYAEAAARYEYLNLVAGEPADGLSVNEIREICQAFGVVQIFSEPPHNGKGEAFGIENLK